MWTYTHAESTTEIAKSDPGTGISRVIHCQKESKEIEDNKGKGKERVESREGQVARRLNRSL